MSVNSSIQFEVAGYKFSKKAGKGPKYKVTLENSDGHKLTLVSGSRKIYENFPIGETVSIRIAQEQTTLDVPGD